MANHILSSCLDLTDIKIYVIIVNMQHILLNIVKIDAEIYSL